MYLLYNRPYLDTQEPFGGKIDRFDTRNGQHVQILTEKFKGAFELAISNPGEMVDSLRMEVLQIYTNNK